MIDRDLVERARNPQSARDRLRWAHLTAHEWAPTLAPRNVARCAAAVVAGGVGRRAYRLLGEDELRATRRTDTVFVFGTGRSLLDVTGAEWKRISDCQTIAFSEFHRNRFVRVDYHLVNEVHDPDAYGESIAGNPDYDETIFIVQKGFFAYRGNQMIGRHGLPRGARIFQYRRYGRARDRLPGDSFTRVAHGWNSCFDAVNVALLLGWRRIVLAGVDMYDRQYSYLPAGETHHGQGTDPPELTPFRGVEKTVALFAEWRQASAERGVELSVYSPRSALAESLPVFSWDAEAP